MSNKNDGGTSWGGALVFWGAIAIIVLVIVGGMAYHDTLESKKSPEVVCIEACKDTCSPNGLTDYDFVVNTTNGCGCRCIR